MECFIGTHDNDDISIFPAIQLCVGYPEPFGKPGSTHTQQIPSQISAAGWWCIRLHDIGIVSARVTLPSSLTSVQTPTVTRHIGTAPPSRIPAYPPLLMTLTRRAACITLTLCLVRVTLPSPDVGPDTNSHSPHRYSPTLPHPRVSPSAHDSHTSRRLHYIDIVSGACHSPFAFDVGRVFFRV